MVNDAPSGRWAMVAGVITRRPYLPYAARTNLAHPVGTTR